MHFTSKLCWFGRIYLNAIKCHRSKMIWWSPFQATMKSNWLLHPKEYRKLKKKLSESVSFILIVKETDAGKGDAICLLDAQLIHIYVVLCIVSSADTDKGIVPMASPCFGKVISLALKKVKSFFYLLKKYQKPSFFILLQNWKENTVWWTVFKITFKWHC